MTSEKLISICLPTYNGAPTIAATLDSIIAASQAVENYQDKLEIVLTDDCSSDATVAIIKDYLTRYDFIRLCQNDSNLGMDKNFRQAALNARGLYVWFSGQDDIFLVDAVSHVFKALQSRPQIRVVNVNFSQYQEEDGRCVCPSMFQQQAHQTQQLNLDQDQVFNNAAEYFRVFNDAPTFLPATIIYRDFWLNTDVSQYYGLCYVQYAVILLNLKNSPILTVSRPLIKGLIPESGWQKNGTKLFNIQLGALKTAALVYQDERNPFPADIFQAKKNNFLRKFPRILFAAAYYGFKPRLENRQDLKKIYGPFITALYFQPLFLVSRLMPRFLLNALMALRKITKQ